MKKMVVGIVIGLVMIWLPCQAEEKLFVTDVLSKKEMEARVSFLYIHDSTDFHRRSPSFLTGNQKNDFFASKYYLGLGLGHELELAAWIPYVFFDKLKNRFDSYPEPQIFRYRKEGFGDFQLGAKYRLFDEQDKPFTLVAGLETKFDTASENDGGTGSTDIRPFVAASATVTHGVRPYVVYSFTDRNHGKKDTHAIKLGVEKELDERVGLNGFLEGSFHTSSDLLTSYEMYHFRVESYIRLYGNLYVLPGVGMAIN
ncbi:MAG: transporter, partial [Thermodesulfobacteriota bacterium]|nr:transporter [Thermodesulfobacteriota bacterium]